MITMSFFKHLKLDNLHPVYYISGNDSWLKQKCLGEIVHNIKEQRKNCQFYRFDGKNINIDDIVNICETVPLGCDFKCVIIQDWEIDKINKRELEILIDIFSDIADFCNVIIINMDICVLKTKIKQLIDIIEKNGLVLEFSRKSQLDTIDFIISEVKNQQCSISRIDAKYLIEYCNNNLSKIYQEICKLTSYCLGREITKDDIKKLVMPSLEIKIFDMLKLINKRDKKGALKMLDGLLDNKEEPVKILSIIFMNFLDIYRAKIAKQNKKPIEDVVSDFDYKGKDFRVKRAFIDCERCTFSQLKNIINMLTETDYRLKTSLINRKTLLIEMLLKIFNYIES